MSLALQNKIILGDCLEELKKLPDDCIDLAFADPPFNLNKKYNNSNDGLSQENYLQWSYVWIDELIRVLKPTGTILIHNIPKWLIYYGNHLNERNLIFRHWIVWDALGIPLGKTLLPAHYGILYYTKSNNYTFNNLRSPHKKCRNCNELIADYGGKKSKIHPDGTVLRDVWTDIHRIKHKKNRDEHPNQLPEKLLERLILMTSNVNDIVLDPHIGTGTTVIVADRLMRNYIGIDNSEKYIKITKQKLAEQNQLKNLTRNQIGDGKN